MLVISLGTSKLATWRRRCLYAVFAAYSEISVFALLGVNDVGCVKVNVLCIFVLYRVFALCTTWLNAHCDGRGRDLVFALPQGCISIISEIFATSQFPHIPQLKKLCWQNQTDKRVFGLVSLHMTEAPANLAIYSNSNANFFRTARDTYFLTT